jgi:uncharacterized membrane protein
MSTEHQIENYLAKLGVHLGPLTLAEREEIVREIRAHIRDSVEETGATVDTVLARLGSPAALAVQYRDGLLITKASRSFSPITLLRATLRVATKGVAGVVVFFLGVFGYACGGGLVLTALVKPILPGNTGVWVEDGHFSSSGVLFPPPPPPAHEILGMGYILIALVVGSLTLLLTTWAIRMFLGFSQRVQAKL